MAAAFTSVVKANGTSTSRRSGPSRSVPDQPGLGVEVMEPNCGERWSAPAVRTRRRRSPRRRGADRYPRILGCGRSSMPDPSWETCRCAVPGRVRPRPTRRKRSWCRPFRRRRSRGAGGNGRRGDQLVHVAARAVKGHPPRRWARPSHLEDGALSGEQGHERLVDRGGRIRAIRQHSEVAQYERAVTVMRAPESVGIACTTIGSGCSCCSTGST